MGCQRNVIPFLQLFSLLTTMSVIVVADAKDNFNDSPEQRRRRRLGGGHRREMWGEQSEEAKEEDESIDAFYDLTLMTKDEVRLNDIHHSIMHGICYATYTKSNMKYLDPQTHAHTHTTET